jgi:hypothetical protein
MKVISQKKFSMNSDSVETSDHAAPTIIIEIKTLDLFQATKRQKAYAERKEGKMLFGNSGCLGHVDLFQAICLLRNVFFDTHSFIIEELSRAL